MPGVRSLLGPERRVPHGLVSGLQDDGRGHGLPVEAQARCYVLHAEGEAPD